MTKTTKIQGLIVGGKPYSSSASYRKGNVVTYNNNAYIALQGTPDTPFTAQAPPTDADSNDYWMLFLKGIKGETGNAATVEVGTVASGTTASVTNSGTTNAAKLDFVLPKGDTGTVTVGTVTTGAAGSSASVTNSGTSSAAVLNITIPKGDAGTGATVVQETGTSTENVMSQKAVTDALNTPLIWQPYKDAQILKISSIDYSTGTIVFTEEHNLQASDSLLSFPTCSTRYGLNISHIPDFVKNLNHIAHTITIVDTKTITIDNIGSSTGNDDFTIFGLSKKYAWSIAQKLAGLEIYSSSTIRMTMMGRIYPPIDFPIVSDYGVDVQCFFGYYKCIATFCNNKKNGYFEMRYKNMNTGIEINDNRLMVDGYSFFTSIVCYGDPYFTCIIEKLG